MKFKEIKTEEKVRLDPKCWTGKKIGNPKTKVKGGVRVNNCVPAESVNEAANPAQQAAIAIAKKKKQGVAEAQGRDEIGSAGVAYQAGYQDGKRAKASGIKPQVNTASWGEYITDYRRGMHDAFNLPAKGMAEGERGRGRPPGRADAWDTTSGQVGRVEKTATGIRHHADPSRYGGTEPDEEDNRLMSKSHISRLGKMTEPDIDEGAYDATVDAPRFVVDPATANKLLTQYDELYQLRDPKYAQSGGVVMYSARPEVTDMLQKMASTNPQQVQALQPGAVAEDFNGEYDDEAGMADNNLETLERAVDGIDDLIDSGDNLPEWCQEKIAVAKSMLVAVWDYMYSEEASDEVDPEVDEMFEAMDQLALEMAAKNGVSADLVWEQFEAMPDNMLYETAAWRRSAGKSKKGGLNAKGVASYRRENPGSKLQMAVTTKPSKLKPGSKAAKRRKSFCARMGGVKGPMKKPNGKPTRKALALRKWNC